MVRAIYDQFNVSRETYGRLELYAALLEKWNPRINLVAKSTIEDLWARHIVDSAQLWSIASVNSGSWLDIGSGGGFPGLVIAAIAHEFAPDLKVSLVESDTRKSVFLKTAARNMGLDVQVFNARIEELQPQNADILSARALSSLDTLLDYSLLHRKPEGISLFPKGQRHNSELTTAQKSWHISYDTIPSLTDAEAVIFKIGAFHRA